jgi:DNA-binding NarL/FixJ family response regulator
VSDRARVMLAEDQPTVRSAVRGRLEEDGFVICAEAEDAEAAIESALRERPEVCMLAVRLPGNGIRAAREISSKVPEAAVVMLAASQDIDDLLASVRAGAIGYLLKDMDPARIPHAIRGVLAGEAAIPRRLVAHLVKELQSQGRRRQVMGHHGPADLTAREWEVVDLLKRGLSTQEISERLFVSPVTVRRHMSSLINKLGARNRRHALVLLEQVETRQNSERTR